MKILFQKEYFVYACLTAAFLIVSILELSTALADSDTNAVSSADGRAKQPVYIGRGGRDEDIGEDLRRNLFQIPNEIPDELIEPAPIGPKCSEGETDQEQPDAEEETAPEREIEQEESRADKKTAVEKEAKGAEDRRETEAPESHDETGPEDEIEGAPELDQPPETESLKPLTKWNIWSFRMLRKQISILRRMSSRMSRT